MSRLLLVVCLTASAICCSATDVSVFEQEVREGVRDLAAKTSVDIMTALQDDDNEISFNSDNPHELLAELLAVELASLTGDLAPSLGEQDPPSLGQAWGLKWRKWFNRAKCGNENKLSCCSCRLCFSKCDKCNVTRRCCCLGLYCDSHVCTAKQTEQKSESATVELDDTLSTWSIAAKTHLRQVVKSFVVEQAGDGLSFCCKCKRCQRSCQQCGKSCCCKGNGGCRCKSCRSRADVLMILDSVDHLSALDQYLDKPLDAVEDMVDEMFADM